MDRGLFYVVEAFVHTTELSAYTTSERNKGTSSGGAQESTNGGEQCRFPDSKAVKYFASQKLLFIGLRV